jgi:hypothetical protein
MRHRLYTMSDSEFKLVQQAQCELLLDAVKRFERKIGQPACEWAAQIMSEGVTDGRLSMDTVKEIVSRIPPEWDRSELIRCLKVHFPAEEFEAFPLKQANRTEYKCEAYKACEKAEARHREIKAKLVAGTATHGERLEELWLDAAIEAADVAWQGHDPAKKRLRQIEIEGILWLLDKIAAPTLAIPTGKATVPMPRRGAFDTPVTGIAPFLDLLF